MNEKEFKKALNIRPDQANMGIIEKLETLSKLDERSLNNYIVRVLSAHVKKKSKLLK